MLRWFDILDSIKLLIIENVTPAFKHLFILSQLFELLKKSVIDVAIVGPISLIEIKSSLVVDINA